MIGNLVCFLLLLGDAVLMTWYGIRLLVRRGWNR